MYNSGTKAIFHLSVEKNETHVSIGLFQGHLGWQKTTVLLEEGVAEFSKNPKGRVPRACPWVNENS